MKRGGTFITLDLCETITVGMALKDKIRLLEAAQKRRPEMADDFQTSLDEAWAMTKRIQKRLRQTHPGLANQFERHG